MPEPSSVTALLASYSQGNRDALDQLMPILYGELRLLAHRARFSWKNDPATPGTTSLVHEAFLNLVDRNHSGFENRAHFLYFASVAMRHILIDEARGQGRLKRGHGSPLAPLDGLQLVAPERSSELLAIDEALTRLTAENERLARIVECRIFGGLTVDETAAALSVSEVTVRRGWNAACAWLHQQVKRR